MGAAAKKRLSGPDAPQVLALVVISHPAGEPTAVKLPCRVASPICTGSGAQVSADGWAARAVVSNNPSNSRNKGERWRMPGRWLDEWRTTKVCNNVKQLPGQ